MNVDSKTMETDAAEKQLLSTLDEDIEFEEFEAEDWVEDDKEKQDLNLWDEDWDDDDLEDDFSAQIRDGKDPPTLPFFVDRDDCRQMCLVLADGDVDYSVHQVFAHVLSSAVLQVLARAISTIPGVSYTPYFLMNLCV
ncbi:hypothetical protein AX774_g4659 [Zancudomyces culisetae]|uniref:26S proteasome complex subunit SEM1 n=1 Tax=Zancudomyces culisetae TaxID=1213189 RepID=A0A1R1PLP5_ZANCU|nr:hypothetical protein AX774_g4659 [Zancudomyces culisetae]|eukprot:OMH81885.1 hypothetical protein AX774_g4659 [Zancudomyces culisetae]